jgi:hypothetical protein
VVVWGVWRAGKLVTVAVCQCFSHVVGVLNKEVEYKLKVVRGVEAKARRLFVEVVAVMGQRRQACGACASQRGGQR